MTRPPNRNKRAIFRYWLAFVALLGLFHLGLLVARDVWEMAMVWTAELLGISLSLLGHAAQVEGNVVTSSLLDVNVIRDCTAVHPGALLIAGILAYPSTLKMKLLGLTSGVPALIAVNQGRLVSLCYVGSLSPDNLEAAHLIVWQSLIVLASVLIFAVWAIFAGER